MFDYMTAHSIVINCALTKTLAEMIIIYYHV